MYFSTDLQDVYLPIPIVGHHHFFYILFGKKTISVECFAIGLAMAPRIFTSLAKHLLFFCQCKGFCIIIYLDILVLIHSKLAGRRAWSFWATHDFLHIWTSIHSEHFLGLCWGIVNMFVSLPSDKLFKVLHMALFLLETKPITVHEVMSFGGKSYSVPLDMHNITNCVVSFWVTCWMLSLSSSLIFFIFPFQLCINFGDFQLQQSPVSLWFPFLK